MLHEDSIVSSSGLLSPYFSLFGENIKGCLWRQLEYSYYKRVTFKTMVSVYRVFSNICKVVGLAKLYYYTPIRNNHNLPNIFQSSYLQQWYTAGIGRIGDLIKIDRMRTFSDLSTLYGLKNNQLFQYYAISRFIRNKSQGLTKFIKIDLF